MTLKLKRTSVNCSKLALKLQNGELLALCENIALNLNLLRGEDDKPSLNLLRYLANYKNNVPDDWIGLRKLDSK